MSQRGYLHETNFRKLKIIKYKYWNSKPHKKYPKGKDSWEGLKKSIKITS